MGQRAVAPCVYPKCDDGHGDAFLTTQVMCDRCRRRFRRLLDWLVLDYVAVKGEMPKPVKRDDTIRSAGTKSFGHPSEWASVLTADIADAMNDADDGLRDALGHEPPPNPYVSEPHRVEHAYRSFVARFDQACEWSGAADTAAQFWDLHQKARFGLGKVPLKQRLPTPCPNCDVASLIRTTDQIECTHCGERIPPERYEWFATVLLDNLIDAYDAREAAKLA